MFSAPLSTGSATGPSCQNSRGPALWPASPDAFPKFICYRRRRQSTPAPPIFKKGPLIPFFGFLMSLLSSRIAGLLLNLPWLGFFPHPLFFLATVWSSFRRNPPLAGLLCLRRHSLQARPLPPLFRWNSNVLDVRAGRCIWPGPIPPLRGKASRSQLQTFRDFFFVRPCDRWRTRTVLIGRLFLSPELQKSTDPRKNPIHVSVFHLVLEWCQQSEFPPKVADGTIAFPSIPRTRRVDYQLIGPPSSYFVAVTSVQRIPPPFFVDR